jgi:hypothetical protein
MATTAATLLANLGLKLLRASDCIIAQQVMSANKLTCYD